MKNTSETYSLNVTFDHRYQLCNQHEENEASHYIEELKLVPSSTRSIPFIYSGYSLVTY